MEKKLQVLLIDDDEDEYFLLKDMFARLPGQGYGTYYALDWAETYEDALIACAQKEYDIHLVDYHLGVHNGLDLVKAAAERGCLAPFILLTGQGSYEVDLAAMELGVYDYLLKDQVNEHLLERTIRYALERKQAEEELELRVRERTRELAEANDLLAATNAQLAAANQELQLEMARRAESEARFRTLAETTSAVIFIVQGGVIRYANPAARFVTGYSAQELTGRELWRLAHPAYQMPLREMRLASSWAENVPARYEIKIINKAGEERWVDLTAGRMQYEDQPAWVITAFDITERDLAEQALRKTRDELEARVALRTAEIQATSRRLETVLRTLPVAIVIADAQGNLVETNAAFRDMWQMSGPLPRSISQMRALHGWWSETGQPVENQDWPLARAIQKGESVIGQLIDITAFNGERKTVIHSAIPILDAQGRVSGGVAVSQDITHQRRLEQQAQAAAREAQQRADELEGLHRATAALLSTLDLDELLCQILDAAQSAIPAAEKGLLHIVSPSSGQLQVRATLGFSDERICVIHSPKVPGYPARVMRDGKPLLVSDAKGDPLFEDEPGFQEEFPDMRSLILAPMYYGERVLGTLSLSAKKPNAFTASNLRLLASFAATTTAALQNAILHAEIKQLAVTDPLTGQYNRRAFFDLGLHEMERFLRLNHPLSAVMIDLDNFKQINDSHGHAVGDQILRMLGERSREIIREKDIFGRYGGDEFAMLLPDTDLETATQIARRFRDEVIANPWVTDRGAVPVSVSMGVATAVPRHRLLEDLLADADLALYRAKSAGKNRVEQQES